MSVTRSSLCVLFILLACCGCHTRPLGGTRWRVVHWVSLAPPTDRNIVLEFRENGQLIITRTTADGEVIVENREHFKIKDKVVMFDSPDLPERALFEHFDDNLRLSTAEFILYLEPVEAKR